MASVCRSPGFRPRRSFREKRAPIACTRCRRLKKRCKPGGTAECQRCHATGHACLIVNVADDTSSSSSRAAISPSPALSMLVEEPVLQSSFTTNQTQYISNSIHDTHSNIFCYPQSGAQPANPSFSPLHDFGQTVCSPTEPSQHSNQTPPSHARMSMLGVPPQSLGSFAPTANHHDDQDFTGATYPPVHLLTYYHEDPPFQSDTYGGTSPNATSSNPYAPYGVPDLGFFIPSNPTSTSDPHEPYGASRTYSTPTTYSQDTSANIYHLPCLYCSRSHTCVVHSSEPNHHLRILKLQGII